MVIFALVEKKSVEVAPAENEAFVPVSDVAFRFVLVAPVKNAVVALSAVAKKFVEVAFVVVASVAEGEGAALEIDAVAEGTGGGGGEGGGVEVCGGGVPDIGIRSGE